MNELTPGQIAAMIFCLVALLAFIGLVYAALLKCYQRNQTPAPEPKHEHDWYVHGTTSQAVLRQPDGTYLVYGFRPYARECLTGGCCATQVAVYHNEELDHWRHVDSNSCISSPWLAQAALKVALQRARKEQAHAL